VSAPDKLNPPRDRKPVPLWVVLPVIFLVVVGVHWPLLRLPYYWNEAGYYIPAARDLLLQGTLIPHSTPSNAHPPLVMAYLALAWKILGYSTVVTRTAMLALSAAVCASAPTDSAIAAQLSKLSPVERAR